MPCVPVVMGYGMLVMASPALVIRYAPLVRS